MSGGECSAACVCIRSRFRARNGACNRARKILELWASQNFPMPDKQFQYKASGKSIAYEELDLERPWETFDIQHELTRTGIEKFVADYRATLSRPA